MNFELKNSIILIIIFSIILGLTEAEAQKATAVAGGDVKGSGGSISYSLGQVVYTTNTATNGSVAQGVQHTYEISVETSIEKVKGIILQCTIFPNPTTDFITLKIENLKIEDLMYQLYDVNGKVLENKKVEENETKIVMCNLVPAIYFLRVSQKNEEIKVFKIIKH